MTAGSGGVAGGEGNSGVKYFPLLMASPVASANFGSFIWRRGEQNQTLCTHGDCSESCMAVF